MNKLFQSKREMFAYVAFGTLTVTVGLPVYMGIFAIAEHLLHIPLADKTTPTYTAVYVIAQILKWIVTVIITFFAHRKWVFHSRGPIKKQLILFCTSRLFTFFLDLLATYGVIFLLSLWLTPEITPVVLGVPLGPELWAKLLVATLVIILNYIISKLIIFRKRKG